MDLSIQEVSSLLQVSEDVVQNWLDAGEIPSYKIQNEVRFSREEIESWVLRSHNQVHQDTNESMMGTQQFNLYRALHKGYVLVDIEGDSKKELIQNSMHAIAKDLDVNPEGITELLLDRENLMSTALNEGVAVPHTRDFLLSKTYDVVVLVYPKKPIEYGALDHKPVHSLFFLFACEDKKHLNLLAKIAYFCNRKDHIELLKQKPSKKDLLNAVRNWEASLAQLQQA